MWESAFILALSFTVCMILSLAESDASKAAGLGYLCFYKACLFVCLLVYCLRRHSDPARSLTSFCRGIHSRLWLVDFLHELGSAVIRDCDSVSWWLGICPHSPRLESTEKYSGLSGIIGQTNTKGTGTGSTYLKNICIKEKYKQTLGEIPVSEGPTPNVNCYCLKTWLILNFQVLMFCH